MEHLPLGQPDSPPLAVGDSGEPVDQHVAASRPSREPASWRTAITGAASLGAPVGIAVFNSLLGEIVAMTEVLVTITVITVALFGSKTLSERAFRLLRWFGNRAEPPAPS